jgi:hypothetical protein
MEDNNQISPEALIATGWERIAFYPRGFELWGYYGRELFYNLYEKTLSVVLER